MAPTYRYDHMHLRSRDVKKTAAYYKEMFDAEIVESIQSDGKPRTIRPGVRIAFVQAPDNVRIELLERR